MTNTMTGIDLRKLLLANGLNPNEYRETELLNCCLEQGYTDAKDIITISKHFRY